MLEHSVTDTILFGVRHYSASPGVCQVTKTDKTQMDFLCRPKMKGGIAEKGLLDRASKPCQTVLFVSNDINLI